MPKLSCRFPNMEPAPPRHHVARRQEGRGPSRFTHPVESGLDHFLARAQGPPSHADVCKPRTQATARFWSAQSRCVPGQVFDTGKWDKRPGCLLRVRDTQTQFMDNSRLQNLGGGSAIVT